MANVMLELMHKFGLDNVNTFGDSTGPFQLTAPLGTRASQG